MAGAAKQAALMLTQQFTGEFFPALQRTDFGDPQIHHPGRDLMSNVTPSGDMGRDFDVRMPGMQPRDAGISAADAGVGAQGNFQRTDIASRQQGNVTPQIFLGHNKRRLFSRSN